jgi:hypothetical protein
MTEQTPAQQMAEALNQRAKRLRENRHLWTDTRIVGTWASGQVAIVDAAALEALAQTWIIRHTGNPQIDRLLASLLASAQTAEEETP